MSTRSRWAPLALGLTAALALSACSGGSSGATGGSASSGPVSGGDLTIARGADASAMNNTNTFDNNSIFVFEQIMEPLFTVSEDGTTTKPWLATGYKVSKDGKTYTIDLRKGVKFSNGTPMKSADVKFSIDQDTKTGEDGWGFINSAIKKVETPSDSQVVIDLKYAWAPFIADLSLFSNGIVPNNYGGESADAFYKHPVGTGPFKWGSWQKGKTLKLVKNTDYWQKGKPYLDSVSWNVVPDANTRKLQLQGGQTDINEAPDWSSLAGLKADPNVEAKTFPSTELDYIAFNQKRSQYADVNVRRAISAAIDQNALIKAALYGNGTPANSFLMPGVPYYDKNTKGISYDLAQAKADLAKSKYPKGFTTTLLVATGNSTQETLSQIIQSQLAKIGITVKIVQLDPTTHKARRAAGDFDMAFAAWTMDIPDPDEWVSFAVNPKGGSHSANTWWDDPEVVKLNAEAQRTVDTKERQRLYSEIQQRAADAAFIKPMFYVPYAYATTKAVQGFEVTPLGNYHLEDVWLKK